jgi:hypothetical protein
VAEILDIWHTYKRSITGAEYCQYRLSYNRTAIYVHAGQTQQWSNQHLCSPIDVQVPGQHSYHHPICNIRRSCYTAEQIYEIHQDMYVDTPAVRLASNPCPEEINGTALEYADKKEQAAN